MASPLHPWELEPKAAIALQAELAPRVQADRPFAVRTDVLVAGLDVSHARFSSRVVAGVVVLHFPSLKVVEQRVWQGRTTFPYIPGLLSFREAPGMLAAVAQLKIEPDLYIVDGQGLAHPRRLGLACHLGLWLGRPTFGCAKSLLRGQFSSVGRERGATAALLDRGEEVGRVVRTRTGVKPVYVSVGHLIDLDSAVSWTLALAPKWRLVEPIRQVHDYVNRVRRQGATPS
jgi:deoxyribonuclease V